MSAITMTGYMGAITKGDPFVLDYNDQDNERLVRVSGVRPADDVCCEVRLYGDPSWMPEIEFRRRATLFVPGCATPSQRLDAATVERRRKALREALEHVDNIAGEMNGAAERAHLIDADDAAMNLADAFGVEFAPGWEDEVAALATEPHQHGGKA